MLIGAPAAVTNAPRSALVGNLIPTEWRGYAVQKMDYE